MPKAAPRVVASTRAEANVVFRYSFSTLISSFGWVEARALAFAPAQTEHGPPAFPAKCRGGASLSALGACRPPGHAGPPGCKPSDLRQNPVRRFSRRGP